MFEKIKISFAPYKQAETDKLPVKEKARSFLYYKVIISTQYFLVYERM